MSMQLDARQEAYSPFASAARSRNVVATYENHHRQRGCSLRL
jgi:hypothetical protein